MLDFLRARRSVMFQALVLAALMVLMTAPVEAKYPDFAKLAKENAPAVVNINTVTKGQQAGRNGQPPQMPNLPPGPLGDMFRDFFEQMPQHPMPRSRPAQSLGSGFIISEDGYVLTNAHVVRGADEISVRLNNQREYAAELIGEDPRTDIALLKIDADGLPTVKIGDSDEVDVGEWVLAIGAPFGLDHSATHGIVSAIGRDLPNETYVPFIQTDAPVNPGNSGGPLINADGEVIGVNSQIYTNSGGYMGISFAIPVNVAMNVAEQLKDTGEVRRGYLGVVIQPVTDELARSFGLEDTRGALVAQVQPDTPAAKAGIESGDIITAFNGKPIRRSGQLPRLVGNAPVGEPATVTVIRDGEERSFEVTLSELDGAMAAGGSVGSTYGLSVEPLEKADRGSLGVRYGVSIESVASDSPFAGALEAGDVILEVNRRPIRSENDLAATLDAAPENRPVAIRLLRRGQPLFLAVDLD
ncbi:DegQ family serine endoprotease [Guyparkeria hydrothermalis]|uniref:DegQ family serine endoprotease n=1 Tax=Guyparkeria hydrothermalis TaxID=923 RepID=UPI002021E8E4|nr:DegQ family serine endoprotease [Guyparkeria hydrothermalis]MCL7744984.1 DegQ family serine endoprotease [Guyparkeria hydrothermalis]